MYDSRLSYWYCEFVLCSWYYFEVKLFSLDKTVPRHDCIRLSAFVFKNFNPIKWYCHRRQKVCAKVLMFLLWSSYKIWHASCLPMACHLASDCLWFRWLCIWKRTKNIIRHDVRLSLDTWLIFLFVLLQASLHAGLDLKQSVDLPPGEDPNDWIAVHGKPDLMGWWTSCFWADSEPCMSRQYHCSECKVSWWVSFCNTTRV